MNIKETDLSALANKLINGTPLPAESIELINRILFYDNSKNLLDGDIVVVLGNPTCLEDRIVKAVEIMQKCSAKFILLSGGVVLPKSALTEANAMRDFCISIGIPKEKIIIENESTTTRENVILSAPIISRLNLPNPRIIVISSASHMRRVKMNFERFKMLFPQHSEFIFVHSIHSSCNPSDWYMWDEAKKTVATELKLIERYIYEYNYSPFDV